MSATLNTTTPEAGQRYRLRGNVERFPHFIAPAGAVGTVTHADEHLIALRMDDHLAGAEEWENEVCWTPEDATYLVPDADPPHVSAWAAVAFNDDCEAVA